MPPGREDHRLQVLSGSNPLEFALEPTAEARD